MSLHKLLTRLILLCVGPLILLAIFLSISSVVSKQAERDGQAHSLAKSVATEIDQHLQARISALHMLSESGLVDDPSHWKELYTEARGFYQGFGSHVILADPEMRMLFNTRVPFGSKLPMLPRPKGYAAVPAALETGKPAVGDVFFGPIAREPLVAIAVPAQRKGTATFLLLTIFETRQFQKYIDQVDLPPRWAMAILDGNGKAIARRAPASPLFAMNAHTYRSIIIKSSASQWSVVLEMPRHIYSLAMIETIVALFAAILVITLVSLWGGVFISRRLGKAIASLAKTPATDAPPPDITEIAAVRSLLDESAEMRGHAEEALRETRDYLQNLLQYANAPIIVWGPDFKITRFNHAFETMTGRMVDEVLGKSIDLLFPDETREESLGHIHKTSIGEHWETVEIPILRKDGTVRTVLWNSATIFGPDGKTVIATIAQGQDITESKQAANALRESEVRYRRLFESAKDGILILDAETGMVIDVNPFLITLLGFSREALLRKKVWELGFLRDIVANQASFAELQYRQYIRYEDKPLETADGRRIDVEFVSNAYLVNHQKVIQCNIRDISDRKRMEKALRESERTLQLFVEHAPAAIAMFDRSMKYVSASHRYTSDYKLTDQDIIGYSHYEIFPEVPERWKEIHRRCLAGATEKSEEDPFPRADGTMDWIRWEMHPWHEKSGEIGGVLLFSEVITDRKRAEEELLKYRDHLEEMVKERTSELAEANLHLQELDHLKSMFIASMSHELRTPLNSIIGFTGIILMGMSGEISAVQKKQLTMVKNSANHLLDLINDVIDVSKIEAGKTDLSIAAFNLSDLTLEVKESFAVAASEKGLNLECRTDGGAEVTSDRRRVRQILVNLVGNAVKFTETGMVAISVAQTGKGVEIKVRDTGIGMDQEDMERLFLAFSRIHIQGQPIVEGTGLGLYLSRRIAALLGGEITAESEPDRGSEFTLSLPWKYLEGKE